MKTNTITTIVLVGILAFSLAACSKSEAPPPKMSERTEPPKSTKQQQPKLPPLAQEALALAEKAFSEKWAQVDDSWFNFYQWRSGGWGAYRSRFVQVKGVSFQVWPITISEADTLNGLQWNGKVGVWIRLEREYIVGDGADKGTAPGWGDWSDTSGGFVPAPYKDRPYKVYTIAKKNGQWAIAAPDADAETDSLKFTKPSEEQIKNILTQ